MGYRRCFGVPGYGQSPAVGMGRSAGASGGSGQLHAEARGSADRRAQATLVDSIDARASESDFESDRHFGVANATSNLITQAYTSLAGNDLREGEGLT